MDNTLENRQIRIFISSTFRDMQDERNYLITKVFPLLQAEAAKRDVTVTPLDLRWGITEEDSKSGKVLQVCLQEIENSHPFFIGILGNRYGWCPPKEEYEKNEILQERWGGWLKKDIDDGLSVTEIEIQHGVLRSKGNMRAHFYLKKCAEIGSDNAEKLEKLKEAIRHNGRYPVDEYMSPVELGEKVKEYFIAMLNELYPNEYLSALDKERNIQSAFLHTRTEVYIPKEENFKVLDYFLNDSEQHHFVVTGETGIGKSALIANWILRHKEDSDRNIIYHFVGFDNAQGNYLQIALRLSEEINNIYNLSTSENLDYTKPEDMLQNSIYSIAGMKTLVIVLDGINKIADEYSAKLLNWLPDAPENVKFLFSTLSDDLTMETFRNRNYPVYTLCSLDTNQKEKLINKYLLKYGKSLSVRQADCIVNNPICATPLVLKTLLDELVNYGCYEKLSERIDYYLASDCAKSFFQRVLERLEQDFGIGIVRQILCLISLSKSGLSENEIIGITGLKNQLEWSQLYCAIRHHLTIKNGLISFGHHYIYDAVTSRYSDYLQHIRWDILRFFKEKRDLRAYDELPYQYYMLEEKDSLLYCILDFDVADYHIRNSFTLFGQYWTMIFANRKQLQNIFCFYLVKCDEINYTNATIIANIGWFFEVYFGVRQVSLAYYYKALDIIRNGQDTSFSNIALVYARIGTTLTESGIVGKFPEAENYFMLAIKQQLLKFGKTSIEVARQYYNLGSLYNRWDKLKEAKDYLILAYSIYEETLGKNDIRNASVLAQLGSVYNQLGEYSKAIDYLSKAKDIYYSKNLTIVEQVADIYYNLAGVYNCRGDKCDNSEDINIAIDYCKKAIDISKNNSFRTKNAGLYYGLLGHIYCHINKYDDAQTCLLEAIEIFKNTVGEDAKELYDAYFSLGELYRETGKIREANAYLLLCSAYYEETFGEDTINTAIVNAFYGYTLYDGNKKLMARKYMLKALKVFEKEYGIMDDRTRSLSADLYYITKELGMI